MTDPIQTAIDEAFARISVAVLAPCIALGERIEQHILELNNMQNPFE